MCDGYDPWRDALNELRRAWVAVPAELTSTTTPREGGVDALLEIVVGGHGRQLFAVQVDRRVPWTPSPTPSAWSFSTRFPVSGSFYVGLELVHVESGVPGRTGEEVGLRVW